MKKIFLLLAFALIFFSCEKEKEHPAINFSQMDKDADSLEIVFDNKLIRIQVDTLVDDTISIILF